MSAALVSQFPENPEALFQAQSGPRGQLNLTKMLSMLGSHENQLLSSLSRSRNSSGSSSTSSSVSSPGTLSAAQLISLLKAEQQQQLQQQIQPPQPLTSVPHRKLDRSLSEPAPVTPDRNNNTLTPAKSVNSSRYKTELCRPFEENGFCKYGDKCQFAHGEAELRNLNRHPKYKTERCRTFHSSGFCPYGPRCHFIHNEDERKLNHISHLKSQQQQQLQVVQQLLQQAQQQQQQSPRSPTQQQSPPSPQNTPPRSSTAAKALNFSLALPPMVRDSLGSTADSPPSSLRNSPVLSPMFTDDVINGQTLSGFSMLSASTPPPQSAPPGFSAPSVFPFPSNPLLTPPGPPMTPPSDQIAFLTAGMEATSLKDEEMMFSPPSPTSSLNDSLDSPMSSIRLPIFNGISRMA